MAKILIAEDEPDIRDLLIFTLQYAGHSVVAANDGLEALQLTTRELRMTGYETCRQIKSGSTTHGIPVVFLSAKGQDSEIQAGMDAGAVAYLLKPFDPAELVEQVSSLLAQYPKAVE